MIQEIKLKNGAVKIYVDGMFIAIRKPDGTYV